MKNKLSKQTLVCIPKYISQILSQIVSVHKVFIIIMIIIIMDRVLILINVDDNVKR